MQWEFDLVKDIRTHTKYDDLDDTRLCDSDIFDNLKKLIKEPYENFTKDNHDILNKIIKNIDKPKTFLEIGVCRNGLDSSTFTILNHVPMDGIYLGVDLEDKSYLNNPSAGIHTIITDSSNHDIVFDKLSNLGVKELDFIFIDGWHSINQILKDWEYTRILSDKGVVAFHDTTAHPGPYYFINNLNNNWFVVPNACPNDYGLGYCIRSVSV